MWDLRHPWKADKASGNIMLAETLPAWTGKDRDDRIQRTNDLEGGVLDTEACGPAATTWTQKAQTQLSEATDSYPGSRG